MGARLLRVAVVTSLTVSTLCAGYAIAFAVEWKVNDSGAASVKIRKLEDELVQQGDTTASGGSFSGTLQAPGAPGSPWPTGFLQFYGQVYFMGLHKDDGDLFSIVN
jgi:hypothetical protein